MAGNLLENLLGLYLGYQGQRGQAYEAAKAAQDVASQKESWAQDYVRNLQRQYASQLAGDVLPSETAYKQNQLHQLNADLTDQQVQAEAAIRNKLAAAGISQGSALPTALGQTEAAKIKAMGKGATDIDAQIQSQINQRMLAAQQIVEGARGSAENVVQNAASQYDQAQQALATSGTNFLNQNLAQILGTLYQGGSFGADYLSALVKGPKTKTLDYFGKTLDKVMNQTEKVSLSKEEQLSAMEKGLTNIKATKKKYGNGDVTVKGTLSPKYSDVINAFKAHSAAIGASSKVQKAINTFYTTPGDTVAKQKHISDMQGWKDLTPEEQNYVYREVTGKNSALSKLLLEQGD